MGSLAEASATPSNTTEIYTYRPTTAWYFRTEYTDDVHKVAHQRDGQTVYSEHLVPNAASATPCSARPPTRGQGTRMECVQPGAERKQLEVTKMCTSHWKLRVRPGISEIFSLIAR